MSQKVVQLKCYCNEYPWGKQGSQSVAARLAAKTPGTDFKLDESKPYAEMYLLLTLLPLLMLTYSGGTAPTLTYRHMSWKREKTSRTSSTRTQTNYWAREWSRNSARTCPTSLRSCPLQKLFRFNCIRSVSLHP